MGLAAGTFQKLANNFINSTFSAFAKTLVMRSAATVTYGTHNGSTTDESGKGILINKNLSRFESQKIELGDEVIFTNASDWTTDPKADNVDITFDGIAYDIINVEKDADDAAYFLTVRRK